MPYFRTGTPASMPSVSAAAAPEPPSGGSGWAGLIQRLRRMKPRIITFLLGYPLGWGVLVLTAFVGGWFIWDVLHIKATLANGPHASGETHELALALMLVVTFLLMLFRVGPATFKHLRARDVGQTPPDAAKEDREKAEREAGELRSSANRTFLVAAVLAVAVGVLWQWPHHTVADDQQTLNSAKSFGASQVSIIQWDYNQATGATKAQVGKILADANKNNGRLQSLQLSGLQPWVLKEASGIKNDLLQDRQKADQAVGKGKA